jgi:ATP adenylyltransferase
MKQLWAPWRMAYVAGDHPSGGSCFLCDAIAGGNDEAALVVDRAPLTVTLLNRFPYSSGHVMVVPTRHALDPRELEPAESAALFAGAQRALAAIDAALHPEGFNLGINLGGAAGGSVEHLHVHVVPRWTGDTNFMPVLADVKGLPELLETTAAKLRDAFRGL